jgi:rfaE bifunctional protein nucleotidyltransferase chain/domain
LLVALNDDASVRRLKGPTRPVNTLEDRAEVLAGLSSVDLVVPFADDRPDRLIEHIRPDVFVKGGDYTEDRLPEAALVRELGGEVQILPLVSDRSTSGLIAKLRDSGSAIDPPASVRPNGSADVGVSPRALRGTVLPSDASPGRHPRRETP